MGLRLQGWMELLGRSRSALAHARASEREQPVVERDPESWEFLPPVVALREQPASPFGRWLIWLVALAVGAFGLWAVLGSLELIAQAPGRFVGVARTQTVQAPAVAVVAAIRVQEGQAVRRGDVLVELDREVSGAEVQQVRSSLSALLAQAWRHRTMLESLDRGSFTPAPGDSRLPASLQQAERQAARASWDDLQARLGQLDAEIALRTAQIESARALQNKASTLGGLAARKADDYRQLGQDGYISGHAVRDQEREQTSLELDAGHLKARTEESLRAVSEARSRKASLVAEARRVAAVSGADALKQASIQEAALGRSQALEKRLTVLAPTDGVVQQLRVFTQGGVVKEAQDLMNIAQMAEGLEMEVMIRNQDIGFVAEGQPATVKVDAFPFTRWGTLEGTLRFVSRDAVQDEKLGLVYTGRVRVHPPPEHGPGSAIKVQQGMSATAEIRTGERKVYEYFLSPILQARHEALRER